MANEINNSPEKPETPEVPETPTTHELDKVVGREAREFMQKYGPTILVSAGLAVAVALGLGAWQNHKQGQIERAERLLSGQPIPEEKLGAGITIQRLQTIVDRYPQTPSAPLALLALASQLYSQGQYEPARNAYLKFEKLYPQHAFVSAAELGRAQCAEASYMTDIALASYEKFIAVHANYYLTPQAVFGKARCLEMRGALDNARITYEDFLAKNPQSPWEQQVKNALQLLDMKKRALAKGQIVSGQVPAIPAVVVTPPAPKPAPAK